MGYSSEPKEWKFLPSGAYILYSSWFPLLYIFLLYSLLRILADKNNDDDDIDEGFHFIEHLYVSAIMLSCLHINYVVTTHVQVIMVLILWMRKLRLREFKSKVRDKKKLKAKIESGTFFIEGLGLYTTHLLWAIQRVVENQNFSSNLSNLVTRDLQIKLTKDISKRRKQSACEMHIHEGVLSDT